MPKHSELKLRIDWSEMDLFGHVNNVSFFKYIQASRVNFWPRFGIDEAKPPTPLGIMLASCSCKYLKPVFYPGEITVYATMEFVKNSSFGFYHRILNEQKELCAEAHDVMVLYDFEKNEKVTIPDDMRKKMQEYQG